ncbi:MAG: NADH-quinone oxidoreductase subunit NuoH [Deltaproteobacteria bacterium]|nr:NADH-quinone oxidoreductase subunit NuoH [Deltaproteobacteria bacterium]MBI3076645.1 NADH-quinone oxidoreductase subunit NuoH [Deltaproteobacteria bacterium]
MRPLVEWLQANVAALKGVPPDVLYLLLLLVGALIVINFVAISAMFFIWLERKVSAHIQNRYGPMLVGGWHGWAQSIADGIKLLQKEDIIPAGADRTLFRMAPFIVFVGSFAAFAALPFGAGLIVSDLNIGLFYILAVTSLVVVGILMAGWASNNKWALLGAMRAAAQIVSYEIPVGLTLLTVVIMAGSLSLVEISRLQEGIHPLFRVAAGGYVIGLPNWFVLQSPFTFVAFFLYFTASLAEVNRTPFDIPEAESELVAGYHTEYSGMRFSFFFLAEYADMFLVSAVAVMLFLGGWQGFAGPQFLLGTAAFILKAYLLVFVQMWVRWTLPRLRVDQLMDVCWKVLLPLAFVNLLGTGAWMLA